MSMIALFTSANATATAAENEFNIIVWIPSKESQVKNLFQAFIQNSPSFLRLCMNISIEVNTELRVLIVPSQDNIHSCEVGLLLIW